MKRKSRKTALSGYYACVSCDLLLMASGADTHILKCKQKRFQETRRAWPKTAGAWFKNQKRNSQPFLQLRLGLCWYRGTLGRSALNALVELWMCLILSNIAVRNIIVITGIFCRHS